jgi:hypothetical protein
MRNHSVWAHHHRCVMLFAGLMIYILLLPLIHGMPAARVATYAGVVTLMIAVVRSTRPRGLILDINVGLGIAYLAMLIPLTFADTLLTPLIGTDTVWMQRAALLTALLFIFGVMIALLRYVMDVSRVTADKLFGAVSIYILIAMAFALLYFLIDRFGFHNFDFSKEEFSGIVDWSDYLYFSFTVLTSTGFGEITPISRLARSIVMIEQVTGVMYVAFLIARLTELFPSKERS